MSKIQVSMDYDPEGDILSITFGTKGRKGKGYELSDYIYIRIDPSTHEPLGLTILSYSKLITLGDIPLSFWIELTPSEQEIMRTVLCSKPINQFLYLKDVTIPIPVGTFQNPSLQEIVAA